MARSYLEYLCEHLRTGLLDSGSQLGDEWALVDPKAWVQAHELLKTHQGLTHFLDLCGVDRGVNTAPRFEVVTHLRNPVTGKRLRLKTRPEGTEPHLPSLVSVFPVANWFEREAFDLMGIRFDGHPNLKRLLCHHTFQGHALRKDFDKRTRGEIPIPETLMDEMQHEGPLSPDFTYLNIGPSHPAMHGCFRILAELAGERVMRAIPELGYLHRCFEKEAESHTWTGVIPYTDRLNYVSPILNNVGYCLTVEKLMGLDIPERAGWLRMLGSEVARICDHLVAIGANLVDIGALTTFWYLFNAREVFTDWLEALTGARLTASYTRIGGVVRDLPPDSNRTLAHAIAKMREAIRDVRALLMGNRIFLDRTCDIGVVSEEDAIAHGFTGPCLRATGNPYDVRRDHPYLYYNDIEWDVPIGSKGDTYDRILVRFEEMEQSARMIEQILQKIPRGPIMTDRRDVALPPQHEVYTSIEGMIAHFELCMKGLTVPAGECYGYIEAANGELGFYVVSDGSEKPYRLKVRPPCLPLYQAFPQLIQGHFVADVVAVLGSLNIIAGELDR